MEYIAFDSHKHYTLASVARPNGQLVREQRLPHERGALQQFLARCEPGSPVAVEPPQPGMSSLALERRSQLQGRTLVPRDSYHPRGQQGARVWGGTLLAIQRACRESQGQDRT
jgi:hypothetical protein